VVIVVVLGPKEEPEVQALMVLKHDNIVPLKRIIYDEHVLYIVMDLGIESLYDTFRRKLVHNSKFTELEIRDYFKGIVEGVVYMHSQGYFHRDLKPDNILRFNDESLKICDFGTAMKMDDHKDPEFYISTRWYRAPECILEFK
jgi:serine/threonine protein kinase